MCKLQGQTGCPYLSTAQMLNKLVGIPRIVHPSVTKKEGKEMNGLNSYGRCGLRSLSKTPASLSSSLSISPLPVHVASLP